MYCISESDSRFVVHQRPRYANHPTSEKVTDLRVLHAYRTYYPDTHGGLEEVIRQICLNTRRQGVESRVMAPTANDSEPILQLDETSIYRPKLTIEIASCSISLSAIPEFAKLVDWADVVHYHHPWPFADVLHFISQVQKPSVLTYHSDIVRQRVLSKLYSPLMNRFLKSVDRIVCTSENYFATSEVLTRYAQKVDVIPIGVNESSHPTPKPEMIERMRQEIGDQFFLFVGVLRYYKGLHILLEAIKGAPYKVVIVGSGPTELELKKQAERLGLTNVIFTGYLPDESKRSLFKLCLAVVFPSYMRSEAFGVTLLEGAMNSRPLISTEVGSGTSHVNVDGETGLVVPPGSSKALRNAMNKLYHQPDLAKLMGAQARKRYERLFTGELMGQRYFDLYQRLLNSRHDTASKISTG